MVNKSKIYNELSIEEKKHISKVVRHNYTDIDYYLNIERIDKDLNILMKNHNDDIEYQQKIGENVESLRLTISKDNINKIAIMINSYQEVYLKKRKIDNKIFYDDEVIKLIFSYIQVLYQYYQIVNKYRRKIKKDFQPIKSVITNIKNLLEVTTRKPLIEELEKELNYLLNLKKRHSQYTKDDELFSLLSIHNTLIEESKDRLPMSGSKPLYRLKSKSIKSLSNEIEKLISSLHKFHSH